VTVEGERLVAYKDTTGKWTIGVGHTGPEIYAGLTITKETSRLLLAHDAAGAAADVDRLVKVPLTDNQRFALISFVFNLGWGCYTTSWRCRAAPTSG
jgi:lysozyme